MERTNLEYILNTIMIMLISIIPIAIGATIIYLVFKKVNKKYVFLFDKLSKIAQTNPESLAVLIKGENNKKNDIIKKLSNIATISKIDIIKTGKIETQLSLKAESTKKGYLEYFIRLSNTDDWTIDEIIDTK